MQTRSEIIAAIDAYGAETGLKPSTICQSAVQNGRLYDRLKRAEEHDAVVARRVLDWIEADRKARLSVSPAAPASEAR